MVEAMDNRMRARLADAGLLFLRLSTGAMLAFGHGLPKLLAFGEKSASFPDPLHVGSFASLSLAIFGELVCSVAVMAGFFTRAAAVPAIITMLVAAILVHTDDPWAKKEFALIYAVPFIALMLTGGGRYSVDALVGRRRAAKG